MTKFLLGKAATIGLIIVNALVPSKTNFIFSDFDQIDRNVKEY